MKREPLGCQLYLLIWCVCTSLFMSVQQFLDKKFFVFFLNRRIQDFIIFNGTLYNLNELYYYLTPCKFFTPVLTGGFFHWSLSDNKSLQDYKYSSQFQQDWARWLGILKGKLLRYLFLWLDFCYRVWFRQVFFFYLHLLDGIGF